jgi:hypothetical protein
MGYSTDFEGAFEITPPLSDVLAAEMKAFAREDHRDPETGRDPKDMPGIWCQWVPEQSRYEGRDEMPWDSLVWDGGEKFYEYDQWLVYLIDHFLKPNGHTLNGDVTWSGEESGDLGMLSVRDNVLTVKNAKVTYE